MEIDYSFLAQSAQVSPSGCFNVLDGGLDGVQVNALPGILPPVSLVVRMVVQPNEFQGDHSLRIEVTEPNGERIEPGVNLPLISKVNPLDANQPNGSLVVVQLFLNAEMAGEYGIHIIIDGRELRRLPLHIRIAQAAPGVPAPAA